MAGHSIAAGATVHQLLPAERRGHLVKQECRADRRYEDLGVAYASTAKDLQISLELHKRGPQQRHLVTACFFREAFLLGP